MRSCWLGRGIAIGHGAVELLAAASRSATARWSCWLGRGIAIGHGAVELLMRRAGLARDEAAEVAVH